MYFSAIKEASAPSPVAVTTCLRYVFLTSPAANIPLIDVLSLSSVIIKPCSSHSNRALNGSELALIPAKMKTPSV